MSSNEYDTQISCYRNKKDAGWIFTLKTLKNNRYKGAVPVFLEIGWMKECVWEYFFFLYEMRDVCD